MPLASPPTLPFVPALQPRPRPLHTAAVRLPPLLTVTHRCTPQLSVCLLFFLRDQVDREVVMTGPQFDFDENELGDGNVSVIAALSACALLAKWLRLLYYFRGSLELSAFVTKLVRSPRDLPTISPRSPHDLPVISPSEALSSSPPSSRSW